MPIQIKEICIGRGKFWNLMSYFGANSIFSAPLLFWRVLTKKNLSLYFLKDKKSQHMRLEI